MNHNRVSGIYAITPETDDTAQLVVKVAAALAGGVRIVQYRNKTGSAGLRRAQCGALAELLRDVNGTLIVNDDSRLAVEVDADGVHLGKDDDTLADARRRLGVDKIIGVSCYNDLARAHELESAGVDYVAFGSFFPSRTKPAAVCAPLELLSRAKTELSVPVVAIGGINKENAIKLIERDADALAVLSALFYVDDVEHEARLLSSLMADRSLQLHY
ncbi:MAG: thiamine phosphate synthase [Betaproteobacteria bacterium]|nr:MAG: thiamine phosphate synthase [Betaproteobacteria bacterium]